MVTMQHSSRQRPADSDLRRRVVRGGAAIVIRQGLGIALGVVNVLFVTRIIGPSQYGIYAAANGMVAFIATAATWGVDVYLLRKSHEPTAAEYNQAFTLLVATSAVFVAALALFRHHIANLAGIPQLVLPIVVMSLYVPLNLINIPGVVRLDRALRFERVARIEIAGQASGYAIAVPLALHGMGCWAPIIGLLAGQALLFVLIYVSAPMRLRLCWDRHLVREMLGYGLSYSGAVWVWQLRALVNPLVVGRFAGAEGVGFVALAIRLVEVLAFIRQVTWRIAMAALAKLGDSKARLRASITEGMSLQVLAVGIPLTVFAGVGPLILPYIFGRRWDPAFRLFPFLALSYLLTATFNLHTSVLALLKQNGQVMKFNLVHVFLFAGSAVLLLPRMGYVGYGWAEVAAFSGYFLLHRYISLNVGSPDYRSAVLWCLACSVVIVISASQSPLRVLAFLLLAIPLLFPAQRAFIERYIHILMHKKTDTEQVVAQL
jgi:O-antigen/teichoic acid export membrane protein